MKQMRMYCCAIATKKKTTCCDLYPGVGLNGFGRHSCMQTLSRAWSIEDLRPRKWVAAFAPMTKVPTTGLLNLYLVWTQHECKWSARLELKTLGRCS